MTPHKSHGFTLIEIMIVVVIVAILSAIAIPTYTDYVMRARIMDAVSGLSSMQTKMEQCYQDAHTYVDCSVCTTAPTSNHFTFACSGSESTTAFTVTATGSGAMLGFVYSVDQANTRKTTGVASGWDTSNTCWITGKGGKC